MISAERLSDVFVEVADTLVAEFDLIEFLHNLTDRATTVSGATAAGLLLADQDHNLHYMAASTEQAKLLELFQLQSSEGPCLDCFRTRQPVINSDLTEAATRWPRFAPQALDAGFRSVHAIPMRLRDQVIGALNLFGAEDVRFEPDDVRVVQAIADVATIGLLQARAIARAESLAEQLQSALNSRVVIEQAKGAVSQMCHVGIDEAFRMLRVYARDNQRRLTDVSHDVITDPGSVPALTTPRGDSAGRPPL